MNNNIKVLYKFVVIAIAIVGIWVAWTEYNENIVQNKKNRSFEFYKEYRTGEILKARIDLATVIDELITIRLQDENLPVHKLCELMIDKLVATYDNRIKYDVVLEFFDSVQKCFNIGACDEETVYHLFTDEAESLWKIISPVVKHRRNNSNPTHGQGLKIIARQKEPEGCPS